jgi:hypothetical protein
VPPEVRKQFSISGLSNPCSINDAVMFERSETSLFVLWRVGLE